MNKVQPFLFTHFLTKFTCTQNDVFIWFSMYFLIKVLHQSMQEQFSRQKRFGGKTLIPVSTHAIIFKGILSLLCHILSCPNSLPSECFFPLFHVTLCIIWSREEVSLLLCTKISFSTIVNCRLSNTRKQERKKGERVQATAVMIYMLHKNTTKKKNSMYIINYTCIM